MLLVSAYIQVNCFYMDPGDRVTDTLSQVGFLNFLFGVFLGYYQFFYFL